MASPFPFSAIVGQEEMKLALMIASVDHLVGGVLVFGDRGTGKSTAIRALASLLPKIKVVKSCSFNCDPERTLPSLCEQCTKPTKATGKLVSIQKTIPVVDLPLGATEDRVLGALDIEIALTKGEKVFEPGLLANANRGFLYIDEVNLLEDHIVDSLLDVAASGENVVEREGLSVRHPAQFVLIGSGNPEEGELRPQLLDRFGLSVEVKTPTDIESRMQIIKLRDEYESDKEAFVKNWKRKDGAVRRKITNAKNLLPSVKVKDKVLKKAALLCSSLGTDGLRGELTLIRSARALASLEGDKQVNEDHLLAVARPSLRHRLRRDPLDESSSTSRVERALQEHFLNVNTNSDQDTSLWDLCVLSAAVVSIAPDLINGISIRSFASDVRKQWLDLFTSFLPEQHTLTKIPINISEERLIGGLDLVATINSGSPIIQEGLLTQADGGYLLLPMAERIQPLTISSICSALDFKQVVIERDGISTTKKTTFAAIAFDESDENESLDDALLDRLAIHIDLHTLSSHDTCPAYLNRSDIEAAIKLMPKVKITKEDQKRICAVAISLGIPSIRATLHAQNVARAIAALHQHETVQNDDLLLATQLVLSPRATMLPAENVEQDLNDEPPQSTENDDKNETKQDDENHESSKSEIDPDDEIILEAAIAAIPRNLLASLTANKNIPALSTGKSGSLQKSKNRGRIIGTRTGVPSGSNKLNLLATLRTAVPWQNIRNMQSSGNKNSLIKIQRDDFRINVFKQKTESATIFVVDASGSSALQRLAEVKGAIEIVLGECYARRDQVALISFRGTQAELLLPPTRSLVRAKRNLASLPGGGGTPLAAGITSASVLANQLLSRGIEPTVVFLTDGRANIAIDGQQGRQVAFEDALKCARQVKSLQIKTLVVDTSSRPHENAKKLADEMNSHYVPLPYADALSISNIIHDTSQNNIQAA